MRILVVGAGAIGGYFGGRLLAAGRDVTFLVRPARAERLRASGLRIRSPKGDAHLPTPPTVTADRLADPFDLVILSCKAYDLDSALESFAPAVGPETTVLPLLNGIAHLDALDARFGPDRSIGGQCLIAATLDPDGTIVHLNDIHALTFGERSGAATDRVAAIEKAFAKTGFEPRTSEAILLEMWEKWVLLASLAAGTSLLRASVGDIVATPGGRDFMLGLLEESRLIAEAAGHAPRPAVLERLRAMLTAAGATTTASMARDIAGGARIEADHVIGDLIRRGRAERPDADLRRLETAFLHLKAYEARRAREAKPG